MLTHLYIRNFTLIDELDIDFHPGFSVITGETGAGKSIILGALSLLLGQRADAKAIKSGCDRCTIEAHFSLDDPQLPEIFDDNDLDYDATDTILRRDISSQGKSRAFVNDVPVALNTLRLIGERLVDIHSQHQNLLLRTAGFQLSVVDAMADNLATRTAYSNTFRQWHEADTQLQQLRESLRQTAAEADFLRFQVNELCDAHLAEGEKEELDNTARAIGNAEDIKTALAQADTLLNADGGIVEQLHSAAQAIDNAAQLYPTLADDISQRIRSAYIDLKDIAADVSRTSEQADFDPAEAERVYARLDMLNALLQKYHAQDVGELIAQRDTLRRRLDSLDASDGQLATLEAQAAQLHIALEQQAATLTAQRTKAAKKVAAALIAHLQSLGMPHVQFEASLQSKPLAADGADEVQFRFTANRNTPLQPLAQIASGGETARVMLALKALLSRQGSQPTIIFDEIDTGVSGHMAERMAMLMQQMAADGRQIITITHLPQIAARGEHHYRVYKEENLFGTTTTHMQPLDNSRRLAEIAAMLSGADITREALDNARALLRQQKSDAFLADTK